MPSGETTLVTGANGFIGSHLVDRLLADGHRVRALVRRGSDLSFLDPRAEVVAGDLTRPLGLRAAAQGLDLVFHVAGQVAAHRERDYGRVNEAGTRDLVRAARKGSPELRRIVLVSSLAASGPSRGGVPARESDVPRPVSRYGRSKLAGELAARAASGAVPVTVVRPAVVYGPRDRDSLPLYRLAQGGLLPALGRRSHVSVLHVTDLVRGIVRAGTRAEGAGRTYHLAAPRAWALSHVLDRIAAEVGGRERRIPIPGPLLRLLGGVSDALSPALGLPVRPLADKLREILGGHWIADTGRARAELGFETSIGLAAGIRATARWYREKGWIAPQLLHR